MRKASVAGISDTSPSIRPAGDDAPHPCLRFCYQGRKMKTQSQIIVLFGYIHLVVSYKQALPQRSRLISSLYSEYMEPDLGY